MPKKKTVASLQSLCLEYVADNMEDIWAKVYSADDNLDSNHLNDTVGPFSILVGPQVQELFRLMRRRGRLTSAVLHLLLVPQLTELDMSSCPQQVRGSLLHLITVKCKNLSSLDLHGCDQIPADALVNLVTSLPCLKKLCLSQTQCDTQVLSAVGSCCPKLCKLDIKECVKLSADSLFYLTYNPLSQSFCSQDLQVLETGPQGPGMNRHDVIWALVFVLLALPRLETLFHNDIAEALCLIYMQQFDDAQIPVGFPALQDMTWDKMANFPNQENSRIMLGLKEIFRVDDYSWPMAQAVCPRLEKVSVNFATRAVLDLNIWSCRHLSHLTISCRERRDMRELLPVVTHLGSQLQSLSVNGFSFREKFSFHALLSHCLNLQKLRIHFRSPVMHGPGTDPKLEALELDFSLSPHEFPWLHDFSLKHLDTMIPLASQNIVLLKESLQYLLKHSPSLVKLQLAGLPFSLDEVFEKILEPPGAALASLQQLTLAKTSVSLGTIYKLLSLDNELCFLELFLCSGIHWKEYAGLLHMVSTEGLKLDIKWI
uniref:Uncharacterized protein n=1 Tax=Anolis carolinensis TaxID=28377 RepID=A0A803T7N6_ANOCA|nr:PREDICTED: uncharacterized protein LOC100552956 isoform X1 [Anolis carolinensis]|eukprot:XP_003229588.1 PREDICTED: uncharacterized protein LOC100552956 isoform X1 [Anolis carolinensis]